MIVFMSGVAALVMGTSGKIVKETTFQYQREQAILLAKSYTEFAIMAASANSDRVNNCLNTINGTFTQGGGYTITVNLSYLLANTATASCANILNATDANITTAGSPINIMVDVYVRYNDLDNPGRNPLTYHRRTLQKI